MNCKGLEGTFYYILKIAEACDILLITETWKCEWKSVEIGHLKELGKMVICQTAKKKGTRGRPSKGQMWIISKEVGEKYIININFISNLHLHGGKTSCCRSLYAIRTKKNKYI